MEWECGQVTARATLTTILRKRWRSVIPSAQVRLLPDYALAVVRVGDPRGRRTPSRSRPCERSILLWIRGDSPQQGGCGGGTVPGGTVGRTQIATSLRCASVLAMTW